MIIDARDVSVSEISTDVAVIGGGFTGLAFAARLRREAIVIEGGAFQHNVADDGQFAIDTTSEALDTSKMRRRMVGGMGSKWSGRCGELNPIDFERRRGIDHSGWPLTHRALAPWYSAARADLGMSSVEAAALGNSTAEQIAQAGPSGLSGQIWDYAFLRRNRPADLPPRFVGQFTTPGRTLLTGTHVIGLVADGRKLTHVTLRTMSGACLRVHARHFVLACGCVEASRLLLESQGSCAELLEPVKAWIGRGFHQHLLIDGGPITASARGAITLQQAFNHFRPRLPLRSRPSRETGLRMGEARMHAQSLLNISATFHYAASGPRSAGETVRLAGRRALGLGTHRARPGIRLELSVEQRINPHNAITLSDGRDPLGGRRASVHWSIDDQEMRTVCDFSAAISEWAGRCDIGQFDPIATVTAARARSMRESLHHMGGTRMSDGPETGVVDSDLRVHGSHNLSILGGSVFPTGGHVNPTLTMIALGARLAAHLDAEAAR